MGQQQSSAAADVPQVPSRLAPRIDQPPFSASRRAFGAPPPDAEPAAPAPPADADGFVDLASVSRAAPGVQRNADAPVMQVAVFGCVCCSPRAQLGRALRAPTIRRTTRVLLPASLTPGARARALRHCSDNSAGQLGVASSKRVVELAVVPSAAAVGAAAGAHHTLLIDAASGLPCSAGDNSHGQVEFTLLYK